MCQHEAAHVSGSIFAPRSAYSDCCSLGPTWPLVPVVLGHTLSAADVHPMCLTPSPRGIVRGLISQPHIIGVGVVLQIRCRLGSDHKVPHVARIACVIYPHGLRMIAHVVINRAWLHTNASKRLDPQVETGPCAVMVGMPRSTVLHTTASASNGTSRWICMLTSS